MSITIGKINGFKDRWIRACFDKHSGDYQQALVCGDVWAAVEGVQEDAYELLGQIGVPRTTKRKCKSMAAALLIIPDKDLWIAVGWVGVRHLAARNKQELAKKTKAIRAEAKGGKLPRPRARILSGGTPASIPSKPVLADGARHLKVLVEEIRRLVEAGYLGIPALSPEAREIVGLSKRKRA